MNARRALSLLEVVVVVTIVALVTSVSTVGMAGLTADSKVRATASDLGSLLRLGRVHASKLGRPTVLRLRRGDCELLTPVMRDNQWALVPRLHRNFPNGVQVSIIDRTDELADVWVHPEATPDMKIRLRCGRSAAIATLDAWVGLKELTLAASESEFSR